MRHIPRPHSGVAGVAALRRPPAPLVARSPADDPAQIGKNYPVEIGLSGSLEPLLAELNERLARHQQSEDRVRVSKRKAQLAQRQVQEQASIRAQIDAERARRPMTAAVLMDAIGKALPPNGVLVDEAVTTSRFLLERLGIQRDPYCYFGHRGWALGWGIGAALGVKLAWPAQPVLGLIGDGAALYGIQGLWTAAHKRIPVTFVIANNAQYKILKDCSEMLPLPEMRRRNYLGMDLTSPEIDFVGLAHSLGVAAERVSEPDELAGRLRDSLSGSVPMLFDVPIER
jgi:benzoylformate decarboxylase